METNQTTAKPADVIDLMIQAMESNPIGFSHTPGPWEISRADKSPCSIQPKGYDFAALAKVYLTDPVSRKRTPEYIGNAHLIAAAPELLAALKMADAFMARVGCHDGHPERSQVIATIAKAEGRA